MISHDPDFQPTAKYRVSIGHQSVTVSCANRVQAIQAARRQLCAEMPRMWDVIHALDESRFVVEDGNEC